MFRLQADPDTQLQVDQVFTPHGHYVNLYVHGPEQLYHVVAFHKSPAPPVQITWTTNHPPPPSFQQVWPVKTFALRYRINHPTSLESAANDLRDALQRGRVIACMEIILRYWQWVDDKTIDIEVVHPLPQPVLPPSTMGIGLALATTSLLPSVPTFATTSLLAKPAFTTTSLPVKLAFATTSLVAPQLALEDDDFGAHKRGISNETELKIHGRPKKRAKPVDVPPPVSSPPSPPSSPLGPPPTSSSSRLPLASYTDSYDGLSFAKVDNVHDSHDDLLSEAKAGADSTVLAGYREFKGQCSTTSDVTATFTISDHSTQTALLVTLCHWDRCMSALVSRLWS